MLGCMGGEREREFEQDECGECGVGVDSSGAPLPTHCVARRKKEQVCEAYGIFDSH